MQFFAAVSAMQVIGFLCCLSSIVTVAWLAASLPSEAQMKTYRLRSEILETLMKAQDGGTIDSTVRDRLKAALRFHDEVQALLDADPSATGAAIDEPLEVGFRQVATARRLLAESREV